MFPSFLEIAVRIPSLTIALLLAHGAGAGLHGQDADAGGGWVMATCTGYSPEDALDEAYRESKGEWRWKTAYGVDVRDRPYGIAAPPAWRGRTVVLPPCCGYLDTDPGYALVCDDTGGAIRRATAETGHLHLDLRFPDEAGALAFGRRELLVFVSDGGRPAPEEAAPVTAAGGPPAVQRPDPGALARPAGE